MMYAISLSDHLNIAQMAHQRRAKLLNLLLILLSLDAKSYGNACYVLFYTKKQEHPTHRLRLYNQKQTLKLRGSPLHKCTAKRQLRQFPRDQKLERNCSFKGLLQQRHMRIAEATNFR